MDLMSFIGVLIVVCVLAWLATFLLGQATPSPVTALAIKVVYVVCVIIIVVVLLNALGLGHNVQIPKVF